MVSKCNKVQQPLFVRVFKIFFLHAAEDESEHEEQEDRSEEDAKEPRDSGCFESSENLENGREEPKPEEELQFEASDEKLNQEEQEQETERKEEAQTEELEAAEAQLQELTVDDGC